MPETEAPAGVIGSEKPLTRLAPKEAKTKGPPKKLPPLNDKYVARTLVTLPTIRLHYSQVYPWAVNARKDPHTGENLPQPDRKGGQFSFIRLRIINKNDGRARIQLVENSAAAKWPIRPFERLANPPGVEAALEMWDTLGRKTDFPQTFETDAAGEEFLELCYGVIEVVFDHKEEMDAVYEANGIVPPSKAYDPLVANDEDKQWSPDGKPVRGPRLDDMAARYASKGV